uniref:Uncharacterized protein n=1 Tax=Meloidogyne enterolobii TaxID=390850 RepID=A0A6V7TV58_MELEN|nr:unnamed protein product [Meloidogyne enterolobii]
MTNLTNLFGNLTFLFNLPGLYSSSITIFFSSSLASLVAFLNPIVTILSVKNYRQIVFRCKNDSNVTPVVPMLPQNSIANRNLVHSI